MAMRLHFLLARRVPPVTSPVLAEAFDLLTRRGFHVTSSIAEEMVSRADEIEPAHDLYVLKSHTELSLGIAGILHERGARTLNPFPACATVQNKIIAARVLRAAGIRAPETWITGDFALLRTLAESRTLIVKPYLGHRGAGISIVRSPHDIAALAPSSTPMVVQTLLPGRGEDLKVYVVGDEVFAVRKPFSETSFTVPGEPCAVTPEVRRMALACGRTFGIGLFGLDIIETDDGPFVVDVNTFPGYKGVPRIAPRIAEYIAEAALGRVALGVAS